MVKIPFIHGVYDENYGTNHKLQPPLAWAKSSRSRPIAQIGPGGASFEDARTLGMLYNDNFLIDGSPFNQCIFNITDGQAKHPWGGHVLVLRSPYHEWHTSFMSFFENAIMKEDLPEVISYFKRYGRS
ncbi:hypothetical protein EIP91_008557 [Steccherinum ochraceum]|uniref:Uncharacterized protein n=1 Tax=Steccherinum ochraceum TaxID=92696 RepID=A0A4V2MV78_9APHY|nr:hypothetical protein EIP91_008557 [Steccherinum ochraceum]